MADDMVRKLATEQRKRFIASMLGAAESSPWWGKLSQTEQRSYRDKVIGCVGVYHDFMLDVIKVSDENTVVNGHALEMIEQVHASNRRIETLVGGRDGPRG